MAPIFIYLLKSIICSGVLFFYYRLALYNKLFHQWNRFYLLGAVLISLVIPLVRIDIPGSSAQTNDTVIRLLNIVSTDQKFLHEDTSTVNNGIQVLDIASFIYISVSVTFLFILIKGLFRLWTLYKSHPKEKLNNICLIFTQEKDAPFSFFRNIFWNVQVDFKSSQGNQILQHEITHVRELHSADRLLMNIILVYSWCNPFYWLIRREMTIVHEFIADRKTVRDKDLTTFSQMILSAAFPKHEFGMTSNFSSSSLKRRIHMLTKLQHPTVNYLSRLLILPVLFLTFAAFSLRTKHTNIPKNIIPFNTITVMIDAGHGGSASGAVAADGTLEKNITLSIAQKILEQNTNKSIRILLTRENDVMQSPGDRVQLAVKQHADAFISLHLNLAESSQSGFDLIVTKQNSGYIKQTQLLGTLISRGIANIYPISTELKRGPATNGIWVLDAPEINYPSIMLNCGNLNNRQDLAFIKNASNQEKIANEILKAIELYAGNKTNQVSFIDQPESVVSIHAEPVIKDTNPVHIKSMDINKNKDNITITLNNNKVVNIKPSTLMTMSASKIIIENPEHYLNSTMTIVDGEVVSNIYNVNMNDVRSLQVVKTIGVHQVKELLLFSTINEKPVINIK